MEPSTGTSVKPAHGTMAHEPSPPSYLDLFAVHLASQLLGYNHVLDHLRQATAAAETEPNASKSFRMYWRTPFLVETTHHVSSPAPAGSMGSKAVESESCKTLFVDITFDFGIKPRVPEKANDLVAFVSMTLGALILLPSNRGGAYVKGLPLTLSQLRDHANSVSIDIDSTDAEPLAASTATAFLAILQNKETSKVTFGDNGNGELIEEDHFDSIQVSVPLWYKVLQETGNLNITSTNSSRLDSNAMEMLLANIIGTRPTNSENDGAGANKEKPAALKLSFSKWWTEASRPPKTSSSRIGVKSDNVVVGKTSSKAPPCNNGNQNGNSVHNSKSDKSMPAVSGQTNGEPKTVPQPETKPATSQTKTRPNVIVSRAGPSKRRKRGKVTYSKTQS